MKMKKVANILLFVVLISFLVASFMYVFAEEVNYITSPKLFPTDYRPSYKPLSADVFWGFFFLNFILWSLLLMFMFNAERITGWFKSKWSEL